MRFCSTINPVSMVHHTVECWTLFCELSAYWNDTKSGRESGEDTAAGSTEHGAQSTEQRVQPEEMLVLWSRLFFHWDFNKPVIDLQSFQVKRKVELFVRGIVALIHHLMIIWVSEEGYCDQGFDASVCRVGAHSCIKVNAPNPLCLL